MLHIPNPQAGTPRKRQHGSGQVDREREGVQVPAGERAEEALRDGVRHPAGGD